MKPHQIKMLGLLLGFAIGVVMADVAASQTRSGQERVDDATIARQVARDMQRVAIPSPAAAARAGQGAPTGIAEAQTIPAVGLSDERQIGRRDPFDAPLGPEAGLLFDADRPGRRGTGPHGRANPEVALRREIEQALYGHAGNAFYGIFDYVEGRVDNGVVTLFGAVTREDKASRIGQLVAQIGGVREVENRITVLSTGAFDNRLRVALARSIYGHEFFWDQSTRPQPPVRILVNQQRVRLAGVVSSEVERQLAASIVQQTVGVRGLENDLAVAPPV